MNPSFEVTITRFEPEDQRQKQMQEFGSATRTRKVMGPWIAGRNINFSKKISPASESMRGYAYMNRGNRIRTCDLLVPNQALYQAELCPDDSIIYCLMRAVSTQGWEC